MSGDAMPSRRAVAVGLPALASLAFAGSRPAVAGIDARTVDPMNMQLVDWLNLGITDRGVFIKGFSVGWYRDIDPNSDQIRRGPTKKLLEALDLQFTKLANQRSTAYVPLAAVLARATLVGWLPPIEMLGSDWKKLEMRHRILVLQTMVAGAHSEAIWHALGETNDSDALTRALANPRRFARSPLPLNPNLMLTRLLDFYADDEMLPTPLAKAVLAIDRRRAGAASGTAETLRQATPDG